MSLVVDHGPAAFLGGAILGLGAALLWVLNGRVAGVSGIVAHVLPPWRSDWSWRALFLLALVFVGIAARALWPERIAVPERSLSLLAVSGLLVGAGTELGRGCTSGHGVCGVARLSLRSIVATLVFVTTGILTATFSGLP